jgi:hypothetical protein
VLIVDRYLDRRDRVRVKAGLQGIAITRGWAEAVSVETMHRESIWRHVSTIGGRFAKEPWPEGKVPVLEVTLVDGTNFEPTVAREQPPWVIFEIPTPDDPRSIERNVLIVREDRVDRIEFRYESESKVARGDVGFRVEPVDSGEASGQNPDPSI